MCIFDWKNVCGNLLMIQGYFQGQNVNLKVKYANILFVARSNESRYDFSANSFQFISFHQQNTMCI